MAADKSAFTTTLGNDTFMRLREVLCVGNFDRSQTGQSIMRIGDLFPRDSEAIPGEVNGSRDERGEAGTDPSIFSQKVEWISALSMR